MVRGYTYSSSPQSQTSSIPYSICSPKGTLAIVPTLLLLVTFHPQPAENCPCFEDAIAFLSVFAGILSGVAWNPYKYADNTLGYQWRDAKEVGFWSAAAIAKLVIGKLSRSVALSI